MNTYITHLRADDKNLYVISDNKQDHEASVKDLVTNGAKVMNVSVAVGGLETTIVNRTITK